MKKITTIRQWLLALTFVFGSNLVSSQILSIESKDSINGHPKNSTFVGGYVKLVSAYDYLGSTNGAAFNLISIPTVGDVKNAALTSNGYQSRMKIRNIYYGDNGDRVEAYVESDFHGAGSGGLRLRHAWVKYKNWKIGHSDSNFGNGDVWLNIVDFDGPPVGTWVRQPQVTYTLPINENNQFNFALEDNVVDVRKEVQVGASKAYLPDFVANYRRSFKGGTLQLAGVSRIITNSSDSSREKINGYGAHLSGTFNLLEKDLFMYSGIAGKGIERYLVGLEGYGLDAAPDANDKLQALPIYGGYLGYQHYWNSNFNSSFMYGYQRLKSDKEVDITLDDVSNYSKVDFIGQYYSANLYFSPVEKVHLGFEFVYGDLKDNILDQKGRNHRMYFTMEYWF